MIAFPSMLIDAAKAVEMKVPDLAETEEFDREEYPHFAVFCYVQLARPILKWDEHWENAKIIVKVPESDIRTITLMELIEKGLQIST